MCAREIVLPNASKLKTLRKGEEMERLREKRKSAWDIKRKSWGPTDGQTDLGYGGKQERSVTWKLLINNFFDHILNSILLYEYIDFYAIRRFIYTTSSSLMESLILKLGLNILMSKHV